MSAIILATIMTMESGKPLHESMGEVTYGTSFIDYYAAEVIRPSGAGGGFIVPTPFTHLGETTPRGRVMAINEAVGVVSLITPWNFPIAMITRKAAPALGKLQLRNSNIETNNLISANFPLGKWIL